MQLKHVEAFVNSNQRLYRRKFFRRFLIEGSVDYLQKTRYAYGYDPDIIDYSPDKKDIRLTYNNIGAKASLASLKMDSSKLQYDLDIYYDFLSVD